MRKNRKNVVAKLLSIVLICATVVCACEEEEPIDESTSSTEQGEQESLPSELTMNVDGVSFKLILVEGGEFTMGATSEQVYDALDNEYPAHKVVLSDFYMAETEVTQELWEAVMGNRPSGYIHDDLLPVEMISWTDAQAFVAELNSITGETFSLPTEAQWEYAARGGKKTGGYLFAGGNEIENLAWYWENSATSTHPVKEKMPNELGLYDMSGNVMEWCADWYGEYGEGEQTDPQGAQEGTNKVLRGGAWYQGEVDLRVSSRTRQTPDCMNNAIGMRLVLKK